MKENFSSPSVFAGPSIEVEVDEEEGVDDEEEDDDGKVVEEEEREDLLSSFQAFCSSERGPVQLSWTKRRSEETARRRRSKCAFSLSVALLTRAD